MEFIWNLDFFEKIPVGKIIFLWSGRAGASGMEVESGESGYKGKGADCDKLAAEVDENGVVYVVVI